MKIRKTLPALLCVLAVLLFPVSGGSRTYQCDNENCPGAADPDCTPPPPREIVDRRVAEDGWLRE